MHRALILVDEEPWRRQRLQVLSARARDALAAVCGTAVPATWTQIIPVVLGSEQTTLDVARALQTAGYDVRAIRPPTVPSGSSRLRITVSVERTEAEIDGLAGCLAHILQAAAD